MNCLGRPSRRQKAVTLATIGGRHTGTLATNVNFISPGEGSGNIGGARECDQSRYTNLILWLTLAAHNVRAM
jgi:hypothetical protein